MTDFEGVVGEVVVCYARLVEHGCVYKRVFSFFEKSIKI